MIDEFETERLVAERLREAHSSDLHRLHSDARVMATLGSNRSEDATHLYLAA